MSGERGTGTKRRTLNFLTATTSLVSLLRHLSTTPYAPSPTTPITSYLFMAAAYTPLRTVHAPSPTQRRSSCESPPRCSVGPQPMFVCAQAAGAGCERGLGGLRTSPLHGPFPFLLRSAPPRPTVSGELRESCC